MRKYSELLLPDNMRQALASKAGTGVIPPQHVDEVVDLGLHAARSAIDAIERIVLQGGNEGVRMAALGISTSVLVGVLPTLLKALEVSTIERGGVVLKQSVSM